MASKKMTVKQLKEKLETLKSERRVWETHWQELADYILPRKNTILTQRFPGEKRSVGLLDSTGVQSNELLSGALHGLLTNPNAEWFELTTGDTDLDREDDVRFFLQKATTTIHNVLNNSNFQTEIHELYMDLCCFGTGAVYIEEDDKDIVRFSTRFIGEFYVCENHLGVIDEIHREWKWDASKIVAEFGLKNVHKKVQDAFEKAKPDKFCIQHSIYPRFNVDPESKNAFTYISQYILPDENYELRESGFREFPYIVPRWSKATGEVYGRSPGMNALPEIKTLNKMTETTIIGAQKVVDPPLQLPDDGFVLPISTKPGGLNFYRSGTNDIIKPLFNESRIDFGTQSLEDRRVRIRQCYHIDKLVLQQGGPQMTATEVLQRTEEQTRLLGPMLGRQQSENARPMIDRVFNICLRKGKIKMEDVPQILLGRRIDVRYSSLIAKSQRLAEGQNLLRAFQALAPIYNVQPTIMDNMNTDKVFRVIAETFGLRQETINTTKERDTIRQSRAQAQQQALDQQHAKEQADSAPKVVDAMNKIQGG